MEIVNVPSIPTKYTFKDFERAVRKIATAKNLIINKENKRGSARRFEVFEFGSDGKPKLLDFWVNHEDKFIYTRDMRKCLKPLGIDEEQLIKALSEGQAIAKSF